MCMCHVCAGNSLYGAPRVHVLGMCVFGGNPRKSGVLLWLGSAGGVVVQTRVGRGLWCQGECPLQYYQPTLFHSMGGVEGV